MTLRGGEGLIHYCYQTHRKAVQEEQNNLDRWAFLLSPANASEGDLFLHYSSLRNNGISLELMQHISQLKPDLIDI
jgi:hypothetical protein